MAKGKKKNPIAARAETKKENPFEAVHSKKKFSILGQRQGGVQKNVNIARSDAVQRRSDTLLVEYKQLKKANAFIDRRFGEYDNEMTEDEKAIQRFQAQRMKQARKGKFTLTGDGDAAGDADGGAALTHLGNPLSQLDDFKDSIGADDGDDDDGAALDAALTAYNFGGGASDGSRKTKKEIMQEIIAKSKTAKAAKAMQKEEDTDLLEDLDTRFAGISRGAIASLVKPVGSNKDDRQKADTEVDQAYDVMRREMVFEGRGAAGERQMTAEEQVEREQEALAKLEKARLKRMQPGDGDEDEVTDVPAGGFAKRRMLAKQEAQADEAQAKAKAQSAGGAEEEDDFAVSDSDEDGSSGDEDGAEAMQTSALDARRAARAAGAHPLQAEFRAKSAQLLLKYGMQPSAQSLAELDGSDSEGSGEGSGKDGSGDEDGSGEDGSGVDSDDVDAAASDSSMEEMSEGDSEGEAGSDAGASDDSGDEGGFEAMLAKAIALKQAASGAGGAAPPAARSGPDAAAVRSRDSDDDSDGEQDEQEEPVHPAKRAKLEAAAAKLAAARLAAAASTTPGSTAAAAGTGGATVDGGTTVDADDEISYTIAVPRDHAAFAKLVRGRSPAQLLTVVQRIRAFNARALAADNKVGLQSLYGIIVQHFATLAGASPPRRDLLDALVPLLATMTAEVPLYAATLARARVAQMHQRTCDAPPGTAPWPPVRTLLLLRLFTIIFPVTDHKHTVLTPLSLYLGRAIALSPPTCPRDISTALFLAGLLSHAAGPRYVPEITALCEALIQSALPEAHRGVRPVCSGHMRIEEGWLHSSNGHKSITSDAVGLDVWATLCEDAGSKAFRKASFRGNALLTCLQLVRAQMASLKGSPALAPAVQPMLEALQALLEHGGLKPHMQGVVSQLVSDAEEDSRVCAQQRTPLVNPAMKGVKAKKLFNPRYEIEFDKDRDYDPDRERADERKMRRSYVKEMRSLKREVGRDAAFIGEVRRSEKEKAGDRRDKTQKKAIAFLQQQESDFKSGGQAGMNPHLKNKNK